MKPREQFYSARSSPLDVLNPDGDARPVARTTDSAARGKAHRERRALIARRQRLIDDRAARADRAALEEPTDDGDHSDADDLVDSLPDLG